MIRSVASKVAWVGRTASMVFGLALVLALVVGAAGAAFGANGQAWKLGRGNVATAITSLGGSSGVDGPMVRLTNNNADANDTALELRVQAGETPMTVNRDTLVPNLNADRLDGKHATEIGVNGLEHVFNSSVTNSDSPKEAVATCPPGKVVVGTGFHVNGGKTGSEPDELTNVVVDDVLPNLHGGVQVTAYEEEATTAPWHVQAIAICATAP